MFAVMDTEIARPHQEELGGLALDDKQVSDLSSALGIMARHRAGKASIKMPGKTWSDYFELVYPIFLDFFCNTFLK